MPEVLRIKKMVFFFYSDDHEPIHVHVRFAEKSCRIELGTLKVTKNKGFKGKDLKLAKQLVQQNDAIIREVWNDYFKKDD